MNELLELFIPGHAIIKYRIFDKTQCNKRKSFIIDDVSYFTEDKIIEIISIKSTIKGSGRNLLNYFCEFFCDYAIVLKAEPMYDTFDEYLSACESGKLNTSITKLSKYYESCGFIDINFYVGYEHSIGFLFNNKIGKEVYELMKEVC